jgi:hypothetical protein
MQRRLNTSRLDFHDQLAKRPSVILSRRLFRPAPLLLLIIALLIGAAAIVYAQLEGGDRGVAPIDSSGSYEVGGITVDVAGKNADDARIGGWREAQRKGWKMLWARVNGQPAAAAPGLPDSTLDSIVGGIVVEDEQIGTTRYIARLGVLFDRARAGQLLGVRGQTMRSPPMLVIPVIWSGSTPQTFEMRTEWQKAWARFRSGGSPIDYVRPSGTGSDPLLLNVAQARRPGRTWWRMLLDQYGAADIVVPEVLLNRQWPGGPVLARFIARHGPDGHVIETFELRAENGDALPAMLDEGVRRIDEAYSRALRVGRLKPDPSLVIEEPELPLDDTLTIDEAVAMVSPMESTAFTIQVETPDAPSVGAAENAIRAVPGVRSASTTSLALGGISVMRVAYDGELGGLRIALAARGWKVEDAGGVLRIRRQGASPPPPDSTTGQPPR